MEVPFPTTWNIFWARTFLSSPPTHGGGALRVCLWTSSLPLPPLDKFLAAHLSFEDTIFAPSQLDFSPCQSWRNSKSPHLFIPAHATDHLVIESNKEFTWWGRLGNNWYSIDQGSATGGPRPICGPRRRFLWAPVIVKTYRKWDSKRVLCKVKCCKLAIPDQD